jgi:hypothetical protein
VSVVPYPEAAAAAEDPDLLALLPSGQRGTRAVEVVLSNSTDQHFSWIAGKFEGAAETLPPGGISPGSYGDWESQNGKALQGTGGEMSYAFAGNMVTVKWNNPFIGGNDYEASISGPTSASFTVDRMGGSGNKSVVFFNVRPVNSPSTTCPAGSFQWIVDNLRAEEEPLSGFDNATGIITTPLKRITGIKNWADTGCRTSMAIGRVLAKSLSTDGFWTIDVKLDQFQNALLTGSNKSVRIEVDPLRGGPPLNLAWGALLLGSPGVGDLIQFSGEILIDHGSFLEVHPTTPITDAPHCDTFPIGARPPRCDSIQQSLFSWNHGQHPTPMGRSEHRACFLTHVGGKFDSMTDEVHAFIDDATKNWFLSGSGTTFASARCIAIDELSDEKRWASPAPSERLAPFVSNQSCHFTRIAGAFNGTDENVDIAAGFDGDLKLGGLAAPTNPGIGASARCIKNIKSAQFSRPWSQNEAALKLGSTDRYPACFLMQVTGNFAGVGEAVHILPNVEPSGELSWLLSGISQQQGVGAAAQCIEL